MEGNFATPVAALAAGLATSLHCTAMCCPLACALRVRPLAYHASRLLSYSVAGLLSGAVGAVVGGVLQGRGARLAPWTFAIVLLLLATGLDKRLPTPGWAASLLLRARLRHSLGLLTPLLPCAPLWLMLGAAATTGGPLAGALHMASFAAGTIPLPFLVQAQAARMQDRLAPEVARRVQRALAFVSAGVLVWRAALPLHASCH